MEEYLWITWILCHELSLDMQFFVAIYSVLTLLVNVRGIQATNTSSSIIAPSPSPIPPTIVLAPISLLIVPAPVPPAGLSQASAPSPQPSLAPFSAATAESRAKGYLTRIYLATSFISKANSDISTLHDILTTTLDQKRQAIMAQVVNDRFPGLAGYLAVKNLDVMKDVLANCKEMAQLAVDQIATCNQHADSATVFLQGSLMVGNRMVGWRQVSILSKLADQMDTAMTMGRTIRAAMQRTAERITPGFQGAQLEADDWGVWTMAANARIAEKYVL